MVLVSLVVTDFPSPCYSFFVSRRIETGTGLSLLSLELKHCPTINTKQTVITTKTTPSKQLYLITKNVSIFNTTDSTDLQVGQKLVYLKSRFQDENSIGVREVVSWQDTDQHLAPLDGEDHIICIRWNKTGTISVELREHTWGCSLVWPPPGSTSLSRRQRRYPNSSSNTRGSSTSSGLSAALPSSQLSRFEREQPAVVQMLLFTQHRVEAKMLGLRLPSPSVPGADWDDAQGHANDRNTSNSFSADRRMRKSIK